VLAGQDSARALSERRELTVTESPLVSSWTMSALLLSGLVVFLNVSCCEDDNLQKVLAPDGRYALISCRRNCGATTGYATIVKLENQSPWSWKGDSDTVLTLDGLPEVSLRWRDPNHAVIRYYNSRWYKRLTSLHGVNFHYELVDSSGVTLVP
jgi:hypothetical protein